MRVKTWYVWFLYWPNTCFQFRVNEAVLWDVCWMFRSYTLGHSHLSVNCFIAWGFFYWILFMVLSFTCHYIFCHIFLNNCILSSDTRLRKLRTSFLNSLYGLRFEMLRLVYGWKKKTMNVGWQMVVKWPASTSFILIHIFEMYLATWNYHY